jgi:hypothetical protein
VLVSGKFRNGAEKKILENRKLVGPAETAVSSSQ